MKLRPLFAVTTKHLSVVLIATAIGLALGLLYSALSPKYYESRTELFLSTPGWNDVLPPSGDEVGTATASLGSAYTQQRAQSYVRLAHTDLVLAAVQRRLQLTDSLQSIASHLEVRAIPDTNILEITGFGSSAAEAVQLSQAGADELSSAIKAIEAGPAGGDSPITPVFLKPATDALRVSEPSRYIYALHGGTAGLLIGLTLATLITAYGGRRILTSEDAVETLHAPLLGEIDLRQTNDAQLDDYSVWAEPATRIRLNLKYAAGDTNVGTMLFVPAGASERIAETGRRVVRLIAKSFVASGTPAIAISATACDRSAIDPDASRGHDDVITAQIDHSAVEPTGLMTTAADLSARHNGSYAPKVVPARFRGFVSKLRFRGLLKLDHEEMVIVAVRTYKDALYLGSGGAQAAVLLVASGETRHSEAAAATRQLRHEDILVVGFVLVTHAQTRQSPSRASIDSTNEGTR